MKNKELLQKLFVTYTDCVASYIDGAIQRYRYHYRMWYVLNCIPENGDKTSIEEVAKESGHKGLTLAFWKNTGMAIELGLVVIQEDGVSFSSKGVTIHGGNIALSPKGQKYIAFLKELVEIGQQCEKAALYSFLKKGERRISQIEELTKQEAISQ